MANEKMMDGNEAAASVAYRLNEIAVIYPITPSSAMGEFADDWAAKGQKNIFGEVPFIYEMQSEAGAIGAVHGALQAGALATTFTASQGLLLMIPNMFKIAGEFSSFVMHVAARSVATHALSIFGDHSDVMSCRQTGFAMLASTCPQEAGDMAAIAQMASLQAKVPFIHFFDGFRTSHEINKVKTLSDDDLKALMDGIDVAANRKRALTPDNPVIRGTAQNPDVFFQIREAGNKLYDETPAFVASAMDKFYEVTGRRYNLVEYHGATDAEKVIVIMGSGSEVATAAADYLNGQGQKVGVLTVHLYRPFPGENFIAALPKTVKTVVVLDRTKESGSVGEPLYLDVTATLNEAFAAGKISSLPKVLGGRYGLSSKEFTPAMAKAVFENETLNHFTVGINDDVTKRSLSYDTDFDIESDEVSRCVFFGIGSDGTVGANKNSIKIIADDGHFYGQAYFVYDSKKSGGMTTSHLRFSTKPIAAPYVITKAGFVACHHFPFLDKVDMLSVANKGAVFLLNAPFDKDEVWNNIPKAVQEEIISKNIKLYAIDALKVAKETGMGHRINTIMQVCFFAISGVLPKEQAIADIKKSIEKTYGKKGADVVAKNIAAVDAALNYLYEIPVPNTANGNKPMAKIVPDNAPDIIKNVTAEIIRGKGDDLPVSAFDFAYDGTWPSGTAKYEKRRIASEIPAWDSKICLQCGKCAMVCPHAAIRLKAFDGELLKDAPQGFKCADYKGKELGEGQKFVVQVSPEDCTGCTLCSGVCPAVSKEDGHKALTMEPIENNLEQEIKNFDFFLKLPEVDRTKINLDLPKFCQMLQPLFEFSGACAGCGETPYVKLVSQLFGDRALIANATGCSSIYSGNLPTTPYTFNNEGRGPAWSNSLFEDAAEFGLGLRFGTNFRKQQAISMLDGLRDKVGDDFANEIINAAQITEADIASQRQRVQQLREKLAGMKNDTVAKNLSDIADYLVNKSVWIFGGDGWAYDIGYGGLDHILHSGQNVNVLVLDTNVYSNTGGQQSKATPIGASAKFAVNGKSMAKKDLGLIAMASGNAYVAQISLGAKDTQAIKAMREAESFNGPSLIIASCHCIAHGYDLTDGLKHQKMAVDTGLWNLFRFDPRRKEQGLNPFQLDSKPTGQSVAEFMELENRFKLVKKMNPERYEQLVAAAQKEINSRRRLYEDIAK